ncbi:type IV pilus assembly protein PilM [Planctopirus limnophila DSM 3776]|uniref:Type IV pilus assembly protein PilM n=1 Tax=Planctopirus limnophila (strain ATCC 43296 / DSM 3776 / IFAM 1008 / Mu 290) TaxID=521674 RepID=D5SMK9_PLAL2|nr:type IV pilus assembly protein PilM [Planctopirus limnophila]ADG65929.1 type IV pilus assembly protein PilM [Planctopirus limnophila DSM 3776]
MAELKSAWGIEIGQAGLKAIKLRYAEASNQVFAVAFDYVPHPKLLSQPDADPDELISEALKTFLSRNQIQGDLLGISLPGSKSLLKFIQLPPVEESKVAEIVRYEARQQIPFPLEDVIWDFQPMGSSSVEGGFMLDAEVGLFAMKRDDIEHQMYPFNQRKLELELVQIAPLAVYNFLWFDRLGQRKDPEQSLNTLADDQYVVALDMGCDQTTLIVTNGKKIWTRNVPIGGNHFTRALTREMKLTFAKAEHLKCNATKSPDPKAVFQAMRPVFNDYVNEIQRSIGFFSSVNRSAQITKLVGLGNGFKLAGLAKFLQQNLNYEVEKIDTFPSSVGDSVLTAPLFHDNILTFTGPYGLALQLLGQTQIHTSLLPPEIVVARKIRRKKPWAVATAAVLLFGLATSVAGYGSVAQSVSKSRFGNAETQADEVAKYASKLDSDYKAQEGRNAAAKERGEKLVKALDSRANWLELYKAIDESLPRDESAEQLDETRIELMNRISLKSVTSKKYDDLATWYNDNAQLAKVSPQYFSAFDKAEARKTGPTGPGYVFTLHGVHFHHAPEDPVKGQGTGYVVNTLLKNLQSFKVTRKDSVTGQVIETPVGQLGISYATVKADPFVLIDYYPMGRPDMASASSAARGLRPGFQPGFNPGGSGAESSYSPPTPGGISSPGIPSPGIPGTGTGRVIDTQLPPEQVNTPRKIHMTNFVVQFVWKPTPEKDRPKEDPALPPVDPAAAPQDGQAAPVATPQTPPAV